MNWTVRRLLPTLSLLALAAGAAAAPRERVPFNDGWRFQREDPPEVAGRLAYAAIRDWVLPTGDDLLAPPARAAARPQGELGADVSYVRPDFDDSGWRRLDLPHDWGIEGPFKQEISGDVGKLPWAGVGWYRKRFALPAADEGRQVQLDVDGAMAYSTVWLNGRFVGGWPYGYSSYRLDLTPYAKRGAENVLVVRLDNPPDSSRWYPGSGLYRNVWLVQTGPLRVAHWGTFVTTPRVSPEQALVNVDVTVENLTAAKAPLELVTRVFLLDGGGHRTGAEVATSAPVHLEIDPARGRQVMRTSVLTVERPRLWDLDAPQRYLAVTTLARGTEVVDEYETPFGIRTIAYDAEKGLLLNGKPVKVKGVCDHHDLGALGTAVHVRALERQVQILKEMGANAIRTSHNPPAPELLEVADRLGMLVMDEAFDCWRRGKRVPPGMKEDDPRVVYLDYAKVFDDWYEKDLRALVRRDRNHPSVVMWSIGNEVIEQWLSDGWKVAARLGGIVREEDRTRPITSATNNEHAGDIGFQTVLDLVGYNYQGQQYGPFHERHPTIPVFGAETASTVSSRGEYFFPVSDDKLQGRSGYQVSSYDLSAPRWAWPPDVEFKRLDVAPHAFGEFVWTGFDYIGEPTPFGDPPAPSRSSYFGIIDLAGFKKDRFYLYQARWRPELPMAHLLPHWNWPERVGQVTPVHLYTSGDEAELFLNGKSLGRKKRGPRDYRLRWDDVVYQPGTLRAVVYKKGKRWAEDTVATAGQPAKLLASADRAQLHADGQDLSFVAVTIADKDGHPVPRTHDRISFKVSGPGEIVATDNGDATSLESFQSKERNAYNGKVLAIVRTRAGERGKVTVTASAEGMEGAQVTLDSQ